MVAEDILLKLAAEYVDEAVLKQAAENARLFQIANSQANVLAVLLTDGLLDEATAQKIMKKAKLVSSERTSVMQAAKGLEEAIRNAKREAEETMALAETAGTSFEKEQDFGMAEKTGTSFERTEGEQKPARYKVIEKLGEGGMGAVYLFQDRLMKRPVALKKVKSDLPKATRDFCIAKFGKEVAATSLFYECDYLVKAYNVQKDEHGDPFLTLEYVRGETLADMLDKIHIDNDPRAVRKFNAKTLAGIFLDICEAVKFMHDKDYVHLDLKPGNVMVKPDGIAKVMDLGLAKNVEEEGSGFPEGTPAYMSPEQARGEQHSFSDDIWALGVILYQILEGEMPFEGRTTGNLLKKIQEEDPVDIRKTKAGIKDKPVELCAIAMKALQKSPSRRYRSVDEMIEDVNAWFEDRPVSAHKDSVYQRASKWIRRHTAATAGIIGGVLFAAAVATGAAGVSMYSAAATRAEARAEREAKEKAETEKKAAEDIAEKNKEMAGRYIAMMEIQKAVVLAQQNRLDEAISHLQGIAKQHDFAIIHTNIGYFYQLQGKTDLAREEYLRAIELDANFFQAYDNLGQLALNVDKDAKKAIEYFTAAIKLNPDYANSYNNRSAAHYADGNLEKTIADMDMAIKKAPGRADLIQNKGYILFMENRHTEALMQFETALSEGHTQAHFYIARIHHLRGDLVKAKREYEECIRSDPTDIKKKAKEYLAQIERN